MEGYAKIVALRIDFAEWEGKGNHEGKEDT